MIDKKAIIFDLGGTLLYLDYPFIAAEFRSYGFEVSEDSFFKAVAQVNDEIEIILKAQPKSTDASRWSIYFEILLKRLHAPFNPQSYIESVLRPRHKSHNLWNHVLPGTRDLLGKLQSRYRLAVISNSDGRAEAKTIQYRLREHLEFVIDSQLVGVEKPDKKIFDLALDKLQLPASECVYVGDIYSIDVVGATGAGLSPILLDRNVKERDDCVVLSSVFELESIFL